MKYDLNEEIFIYSYNITKYILFYHDELLIFALLDLISTFYSEYVIYKKQPMIFYTILININL